MSRSIAGSCGNNRGKRARGLEYKQKHKPLFRLYRAAKSQGRQKKKGEDCLNGGLLSPSPVFCNAKYRGGVRRTEGLIKHRQQQNQVSILSPLCSYKEYRGSTHRARGLKNSDSNKIRYQTLPLCSYKEYRGSAHRARGLKYKQEHKPQFRLYRAAKTQGRRRKKGEDCPSGVSSAAPDGETVATSP